MKEISFKIHNLTRRREGCKSKNKSAFHSPALILLPKVLAIQFRVSRSGKYLSRGKVDNERLTSVGPYRPHRLWLALLATRLSREMVKC